MKKISILLVVICFLILGLAGCGVTGTAKSEKASFHASNPYEGDLSGVTLDIGAAGIQNAQGVLQAAGLDERSRPEQLTLENYCALQTALANI